MDIAHKMGITSPLDAVPSITLGTSGVTPLEMADAYATLAANGIHHKPQAIVKVERRGKTIWKPKTKGKRAIPAGVASVVTQCLERVASAGTGSATGSYFPYPRAGKTGTTENGWDVWYVRLHAQPRRRGLDGRRREELAHDGAYGGDYSAPMWAKFFAAALKDQAHPSFKRFPWTFSSGRASTPSAVGVGVAVAERERHAEPRARPRPSRRSRSRRRPSRRRRRQADADHAQADADTPEPTPTARRPPAPSRSSRRSPRRSTWRSRSRRPERPAGATNTGGGDTGLAGAAADWVAGLLGL